MIRKYPEDLRSFVVVRDTHGRPIGSWFSGKREINSMERNYFDVEINPGEFLQKRGVPGRIAFIGYPMLDRFCDETEKPAGIYSLVEQVYNTA